MNKTRRKGFTLVELLAVIVILAVVILIAVTAVVPRMNNAKKKAFIDEALVYLKAGKEMLVSDNAHGCYLISDLGNYVKQNKDGYIGTIFISDSRVSLNLTNGKYYLKADNNTNISETDLVDTAPSDFLSTCTAPSSPKSYNITYVLNDGNVSGTNPSSYTSYSDDIHLINPTRSGYRFVGWSGGKNIFDEETIFSSITDSSFENDYYVFTYGNAYSKYGNSIPVSFRSGVRYTYSFVGHVLTSGINFSFTYADGSNTALRIGATEDKFRTLTSKTNADVVDGYISYSTGGSNKAYVNRFQVEEGITPTEYEKYVSNNTNVTIPKGSSGNRVYTANWEAL